MEALANYYVCLEGGGSKIECVVLDSRKGERVELKQSDPYGNETNLFVAKVAGANVNYDGGREKLEDSLRELFTKVQIAENGCTLGDLLPQARVIAGMAGVARKDPREVVTVIFEKVGVNREILDLQGDAEWWLTGAKEPNVVVVISGTGHGISGKINNKTRDETNKTRDERGEVFRLGGWGPGDHLEVASGYNVGLEGIEAVRGMQYEKAPETSLATALKEYFGESDGSVVRNSIPTKYSVAKVAKFAEKVFDAAFKENDCVAEEIITRCFIQEVANKVATFVKRQGMRDVAIKYVGGLMRNVDCKQLVEAAVAERLDALSIKFSQENLSERHVAEEYVKNKIIKGP